MILMICGCSTQGIYHRLYMMHHSCQIETVDAFLSCAHYIMFYQNVSKKFYYKFLEKHDKQKGLIFSNKYQAIKDQQYPARKRHIFGVGGGEGEWGSGE